VPKYGEKLFLDYDIDSIEALQENTDTKAARVRADYQAGILKLNEARTAIGYEEIPGGDIHLVPGQVWVLDDSGEIVLGPKQGAEQSGGEDPNAEDQKKGFFLT
jgi:hypothetical protein